MRKAIVPYPFDQLPHSQVKEQQQHRPYYYNGNHQANAPPLLAQLALATPGVLVSVIVSTTFCVLVAPTVVTAFHFVSVRVCRGAMTVSIVTERLAYLLSQAPAPSLA